LMLCAMLRRRNSGTQVHSTILLAGYRNTPTFNSLIIMQIKVPTSWNDVALWQYERIASIPKDTTQLERLTATISALADMDKQEVKKMPLTLVNEIMREIDFVFTAPIPDELVREFEYEGVKYVLTEPSKMTLGQWVDAEHYIKNDSPINSQLAAVLFVEEGQEYNGTTAQRIEACESQNVPTLYGAMLFFSAFGGELYKGTQAYSQAVEKMKENGMLTTLPTSGDGTELFTASLMATLQNLNQSQE
jgi:hypothetical protein